MIQDPEGMEEELFRQLIGPDSLPLILEDIKRLWLLAGKERPIQVPDY
jgi:hypothetical protein